MPSHLKRFQAFGHSHFITFSCHDRKPYLTSSESKNIFLKSLEQTRDVYNFLLYGYVIMPEHVHLLMSEPPNKPLSSAIHSLKLSVSKQSPQKPFWLPRYYDRNIKGIDEKIDVLRYIHRNPVKRELVEKPEEWSASSFRHYFLHEPSTVVITKPTE